MSDRGRIFPVPPPLDDEGKAIVVLATIAGAFCFFVVIPAVSMLLQVVGITVIKYVRGIQ